ncbi:transposase [Gilliamella sp. HK7]|uniref:transposase n=1 Tax=unclassified Gilliamella TaxID=2685620 RepID=UPI003FA5B0CA
MTLFNRSYHCYGTRRIGFDLQKENIWVSRCYIVRLMKFLLLVSKYVVKRYCNYPLNFYLKCVAIPIFYFFAVLF